MARKHPPLPAPTLRRSRELRRQDTPAEQLLWGALRGRRLAGLKFRRQHALGPHIADFYCHDARLVIELDGESHDLQVEYDKQRTQLLESQGVRVLRLANEDVLSNLEGVLCAIALAAGREIRLS